MMKIFIAMNAEKTFDEIMSLLSDIDGIEIKPCTKYAANILSEIFKFDPDTIITDLKLPGNTKIDFIRILKKIYPDILIIISCHTSNNEVKIQYLNEGVQFVIDNEDEFEYLNIVLGKICENVKEVYPSLC